MVLTALVTLLVNALLGGGSSGTVNFGPTAAGVTLTTVATIDVRDYQTLSVLLKNTDAADSMDYYIEGAVKEVPDDATDIDWAPLTEIYETTEITNIALAIGVKELLTFNVLGFSYVRIRVERTAAADSEVTGSIRATRIKA